MQKRIMQLSGLLIIAIFFFACGNQAESQYEDKNTAAEAPMTEEYDEAPTQEGGVPQHPSDNLTAKIEPMLMKEGRLTIDVKDYQAFRASMNEVLKKHEAVIFDEEQQNYSTSIQNTLTIRVPSQRFDQLLADFEGKEGGTVGYKNVSVSDVTAEFLDISARLKTRMEVRDRYRALLAKANSVDEIIKVEEAIRAIQEEIEAAEGRVKYLKSRTSMSTIILTLTENMPNGDGGFFSDLADAFASGWQGFLMAVIGITHLWMFVLVAIIVGYFVRKRWKQRN